MVDRERNVIRDQLLRNHVSVIEGAARFADPHTLAVADGDGRERSVTAERIVIAVGSEPDHAQDVDFNGRTILDSDDIVLRLETIPDSLVVVGAGVIGIEFASMFAALGTRVTVVDGRQRAARVLRPRGGRGTAISPARPERRLPIRRAGDGGRRESRSAP